MNQLGLRLRSLHLDVTSRNIALSENPNSGANSMRLVKVLLFLLLAFPCFGQTADIFAPSPKHTVKFDKFQYETRFRLPLNVERDNFYGGRMELVITVICPVKGKPSHYFHFVPERKLHIYDHPTLRMLVDGLLMEIKSNDIDDTAIFKLRPEQFDFISRSKTVDIQLSPFEGSLDAESIAAIRALQEAITKLPADPVPR